MHASNFSGVCLGCRVFVEQKVALHSRSISCDDTR